MDTDDLSNEAYKAVLITAEKFNHDLTVEFGSLAYFCKTEDEFLGKCEKLIHNWQSDLELALTEIFVDDIPVEKVFNDALLEILKNIQSVRKISLNKRVFR